MKKVKLHALITKPPSLTRQMYWKCPSRACQHYQYILVGFYPDKATGNIQCPICHIAYSISCSRNGSELVVLAELKDNKPMPAELIESNKTL